MSQEKVEVGPLVMLGALILLVIMLIMMPFCIVWSVDNGNVGIISNRGEIQDDTLPAGGPYMVKPWKSVYRIDIKTHRYEEEANLPTKGGLAVKVKAILLYSVDPAKAVDIFRTYGADYEKKIVDTEFTNAIRDASGEFAPEAFYNEDRPKLEGRAFLLTVSKLTPHGFKVDSVLFQDPVLPEVVRNSINAKVGAEQDALRMAYVFKSREQEGMATKRQKELAAEAQVIEAKGIAESQLIIKKDLDENYLTYLFIKSLEANHAAAYYVPVGPNGLPMFGRVKAPSDPVK